jgi:hypothetical protein
LAPSALLACLAGPETKVREAATGFIPSEYNGDADDLVSAATDALLRAFEATVPPDEPGALLLLLKIIRSKNLMTRTSAEHVQKLQRALWEVLTRHGDARVANAVYSALLLTTTQETRWPLFSVVLELGAQSQSARALRDRVLPKLGCLLRTEEAPEALLKILAWLRSAPTNTEVPSEDHARAMVAASGRLPVWDKENAEAAGYVERFARHRAQLEAFRKSLPPSWKDNIRPCNVPVELYDLHSIQAKVQKATQSLRSALEGEHPRPLDDKRYSRRLSRGETASGDLNDLREKVRALDAARSG